MSADYSCEAEQSVLGALLLDNASWWKIIGSLDTGDFYDSQHRRIFNAVVDLIAKNQPGDAVTVAEELKDKADWEYVLSLANNVPSAANIKGYAAIVQGYARKRRAKLALKNSLAALDEQPVEEAVNVCMISLQDLQHTGHPDKSFAIALDEAVKAANEACNRRSAGTIAGLSTTFPTLDKLTGGLHGPKMVVLGGRPGTYKSVIVWQILLRAAKRGLPVGMILLEMDGAELGVRALASELKISGHAFASGDRRTLADSHTKMRPELRDWPIRIDDHSTYLSEIIARIVEWKFRFDIQIACIDHLQLIYHQKAANRFQELSEVSRQMKLLAMRLGIPIVLLSQLSREVERDDREPRLSDLRECGNIEQDADIVIFTRCIPGRGQGKDEFELILAKQRQGAARRVISLAINGEHYFVGERA